MVTVKQKFTGDTSQLAREYDKLLAQQVKLESQLLDVKNTAVASMKSQRTAASSFQSAAKKAGASIKSMAAQYIGVQSAIRLVVNELERKKRLELASKDTAMRVADSEAAVIINLGGLSTDIKKRFIDDVGDIRKTSGLASVAPLLEAASTTLSATAGDQKLTLDLLKTLAPIFRSDAESLPTAASSTADIAKAAEVNAKQATGLVLSMMAQSRVIELKAFKNVAPALASVVNSQLTTDATAQQGLREGAALFASMGSTIADEDGAISKGLTSALANALERNFEKAGSLADRLRAAQDMGASIRSGTATEKELKTMQDIEEDLLSKGFRGPTIAPVRTLLSGRDNKIAKQFESALSQISFDEKAVDTLTEQLRDGTLNLAAASASRRTAGSLEESQLSGQSVVLGTVRDQLQKVFETQDSSALGGTRAFLSDARFTASPTPETALEILKDRERIIRGEIISRYTRRPARDDELTELDRNAIAVLREAMGEIRDIQKRNADVGSAAVQSRVNVESN